MAYCVGVYSLVFDIAHHDKLGGELPTA